MNALIKYNNRAKKVNSLLCVGLDADFSKLPERFLQKPFPQFEFNTWIIEQTHAYVSAYKLNSAFYEARGEQGLRELKMTFDYLALYHSNIFLILDAKRADTSNTNVGYAEFAFDQLGADAVTLHPYMGHEAMAPFLERKDKISIILCRTSNTGAEEFQNLLSEGKPLWQTIAERVTSEWNTNGNCMLVVGAPHPEEIKKVREISKEMTLLVPGVSDEGINIKSVVQSGLNKDGLGLIINASRRIIFAKNPEEEARKLCEEIRMSTGKNR